MSFSKSLLLPALAALLLLPPTIRADDDDAAPAAASSSALPALSSAQQQAAGVVIAHPVKASPSARTQAYARVLDPSTLVSDTGRLQSAHATERAASTELSRLQKLYSSGGGASMKAVETARATEIDASVQAHSAAVDFALHWGPLAKLSGAAQQRLIDALLAGRTLLLRADLLGRHSLGQMPHTALIDVDGVRVPAQVLGTLPQTAPNLQSVGLLLQMQHPPAGLGAGARLPAILEGTPRSGVVVPNRALLYGTQGAYVYRQLAAKSKDGDTQFTPVPVTLLQRSGGDGWLVGGIDDDDSIVVRGAGVLWSLQGLRYISDDDD